MLWLRFVGYRNSGFLFDTSEFRSVKNPEKGLWDQLNSKSLISSLITEG
jgi:hypothetical protein